MIAAEPVAVATAGGLIEGAAIMLGAALISVTIFRKLKL